MLASTSVVNPIATASPSDIPEWTAKKKYVYFLVWGDYFSFPYSAPIRRFYIERDHADVDALDIGYILKILSSCLLWAEETCTMPRPKKCLCEQVDFSPVERCFRPCGMLARKNLEIRLSTEEFEAFRLRHLEGMGQESAASHMGTSQSTYQRMLERAAIKIARALADGHPLFIDVPYSHS